MKFSPFPMDGIFIISSTQINESTITCKWFISTILGCDYIFFREDLFQLIKLFVIALRHQYWG